MANSQTKQSGGMSGVAVMGLIFVSIICFVCALCVGSVLLFGSIDPAEFDSISSSSNLDVTETVVSEAGSGSNRDKFLSIPITGIILGDAALDGDLSGGLFGIAGTYGYEIKNQIEGAAGESDIKGLILEINSGGGTINGSRAIHQAIKDYRSNTGNPVVAFCSGVCASGAYWVASAADYIVVDYGTSAGSIGVIYGPFKFYDEVIAEGGGLLSGQVITQNGIETRYFTAGEFKDTGNPYRRLAREEIEIIQAGLNDEYTGFVNSVADSRADLTAAEIRNEIRALLYAADQSVELGLTDEVADRDAAYAKLADLAGQANYQVIRRSQNLSFWDTLFMISSGQPAPSAQSQNTLGLAGENDVVSNCTLCSRPLFLHGEVPTQ